jgi:hypothetical protein
MEQKSKMGILIALVVVLSGTTIYFAAQKSAYAPTPVQTVPDQSVTRQAPAATNQNATQNQDATNNQPASASANETASWKTYTNNTYGFSFKYPSQYVIDDDLKYKRIYIQYPKGDFNKGNAPDDWKIMWIAYDYSSKDITFNNPDGSSETILGENESDYKSNSSSLNKKYSIDLLSGMQARAYERVPTSKDIKEENELSMPLFIAFWSAKNIRYYATIGLETGNERAEIDAIKQILPTFQFTK